MEQTLILIKPDAVSRKKIGEIITRIENKGYALVAMKMLQMTPEMAKQHYAEHVSKPFYPALEEYITQSLIVALIAEGPEVVRAVRTLVGSTNGLEAAPGTIRGDFSITNRENLVHASDSPESATREIAIFFEKR